jgi:AraC-like DNA-binding protein
VKGHARGGAPELHGEFSDWALQYYPSLRRVRAYVEDHIGEKVSLEKIVQVACMEHNYFCKFFHKKVGTTFTPWLNHVRITEAIRRIRESDYSITELSFAVGFEDLRTFERAKINTDTKMIWIRAMILFAIAGSAITRVWTVLQLR